MRDTKHFKNHMTIVTHVDNKKVGEVPIEDPFHHTTVHIVTTFWERVRNIFKSTTLVRVHVRADGVAVGRWFYGADVCEKCKRTRIGPPYDGSNSREPGYHHGDERWCESCYYGREEPSIGNSVASHENSSN